MAHSGKNKKQDLISRGQKFPTLLGRALFVGLRALDPFFQYSILAHGVGASVLHKVGLTTLPPGLPTQTGISLIDGLQLSSYRLILLSMAVGSMVKQNIWVTAISGEPMPIPAALIIGIFNTIFNSVNSYLFICSQTSASISSNAGFPQIPLVVGSAMYTVGILTELISEIQRARFKKDPKNAGKPYTGGLWSLARHINYGAFTVWRAGYAIASGGWTWGLVTGAFFFYDFVTRGVPVLDEYCTKRVSYEFSACHQSVNISLTTTQRNSMERIGMISRQKYRTSFCLASISRVALSYLRLSSLYCAVTIVCSNGATYFKYSFQLKDCRKINTFTPTLHLVIIEARNKPLFLILI